MVKDQLKLASLIVSALLVQLVVQNFGQELNSLIFNSSKNSFMWPHFILRNGLAMIFIFLVIKAPLKQMGLTWPQLEKRNWIFLFFLLVIITMAVYHYTHHDLSVHYYAKNYANHATHPWVRIKHFFIFTFSTLIGYELLHRCLLLFGIIIILTKNAKIHVPWAQLLAILIVTCFETLFHLVKPPGESFGMLLASPFLSYLAIRSKSIWPSFLLHLYIEFVFIFFLVFTL